MGRRKEAEHLTKEDIRARMLLRISSEAAVNLYDQGMEELEKRGQADYMSALQLRDAVQWTEAIDSMQRALLASAADAQAFDGKKIAVLIKNKQQAEDARRRVLDGLLLTPQKPRGRPPRQDAAGEEIPDSEDDGWDSFGELDMEPDVTDT